MKQIMPPKNLYRYRPSGSDFFEEEVRQLRNNGIFLTPAKFLNDPFDCNPAIQKSSIRDLTREIRRFGFEKFRKIRMDHAKASGEYAPKRLQELRKRYETPTKSAIFESPLLNDLLSVYRKNDLRVSCLSEVHDSILMWSHYAEGHKGFVVKYKVLSPRGGSKTSAAPIKVNYVSDRPIFSSIDILLWRLDSLQGDEVHEDPLLDAFYLSKAEIWSSEEEWRLIESASNGGGYYYYENMVPIQIIVGINMPERNVEFLRKTLPEIDICRARIDPVSYSMCFE